MSDDRVWGALPPPGSEWMIGLTVAEIEAIQKEAEDSGKTASEVAAERKNENA